MPPCDVAHARDDEYADGVFVANSSRNVKKIMPRNTGFLPAFFGAFRPEPFELIGRQQRL